MQGARLPFSRSLLDWLDRQPDRVCWPLGLALGTVPSLGMMLVHPTAGLITGGLTLGAAVWLGLTGDPIALPVADLPEPLEMIELPGGEFWMGSPETEPGRGNDEIRHRVRVSAFAMAKYPVTQKLYQEVMGDNPSYRKGEDLPIEMVSWFDAVRFCNKLSERVGLRPCYRIVEPKQPMPQQQKEEEGDDAWAKARPEVEWEQSGEGYRLPTEAEWEYACRAGTETAYSFGDDPAQLGDYAWFGSNSEVRTHEVGTKKPNGWGLYDLYGNVWEWCWDWYGEYQATRDNDSSVMVSCPIGPPIGDRRVLRGGSFAFEPVELRCAARGWFLPEDRLQAWGFRCVRGVRQ